MSLRLTIGPRRPAKGTGRYALTPIALFASAAIICATILPVAAVRAQELPAARLAAPSAAAAPVAKPVAAAPASQPCRFDADAYLAHIKFLASDELEGRLTGTPGNDQAAEYIAGQFKDAGLSPGGDDGSYFQAFKVRRGKMIDEDEADLAVEELERVWHVQKDWVPLPFSGEEGVDGPLAFVGYGIKATRFDYNDYADFDAAGKILLMFRYEPVADDPNAEFGGKTASRNALFQRKIATAAKAKAKGVLIVNPPGRPAEADELFPWDEELSEQTYDLPATHITRAMAEALLKRGGLPPLAELVRKLDEERKPLSADLHLTAHLKAGLVPRMVAARNVLGVLKGDGTTDETIVVGAHYDHLGKSGGASGKDGAAQIFHGADDNASGTAGVIELARWLARQSHHLHRNVLFISFSGEELGLLGSKHFVADPTVPLDEIRAMVNLDMIGRLSLHKFAVFGTASAPELRDLVRKTADAHELQCKTPGGAADAGSDHAPFQAREIPVLFAFTGIHKQYHKPEDTWDLIDAPGAARVLDMLADVICDLANMKTGPVFKSKGADEAGEEAPPIKPGIEHERDAAAQERNGDENHDAGEQPEGGVARTRRGEASKVNPQGKAGGKEAGETERPSRPKARLGIVPDYSGDKAGVIVENLVDGGAAKAAGLQEGDRIIKIGEQAIKDIYGYMRAMGTYKAGDSFDVVVVRKTKEGGEKELTLKVTLKEEGERPAKEKE